jgi:hypothetical protein
MKIRPVRAYLFHADGLTDATKLIVAIRNFAKAPRNEVRSADLHPEFPCSNLGRGSG